MRSLYKNLTYKTPVIIAALATVLAISACNKVDEETEEELAIEIDLDDGTSVSTSTSNSSNGSSTSISSNNGNSSSSSSSSTSSSSDGKFSLKANGVDINIDIPKSIIEKSNRSDDLYPGSKIRGVNVNSQTQNNNGNSSGKGQVEIKFFAPDKPATVADWFVKKFEKEGGSAKRTGTNVSGKTDDGKDYNLTVTSDGEGSSAVLAFSGDS